MRRHLAADKRATATPLHLAERQMSVATMIVAIVDTNVIAGVNAHKMRPAVAPIATALATVAIITLERLFRHCGR